MAQGSDHQSQYIVVCQNVSDFSSLEDNIDGLEHVECVVEVMVGVTGVVV